MNNQIDRSQNIKLGSDGKYHWVYELNLYRNPVILGVLYKIFGVIIIGLFLFSTLLSCGGHNFWWSGFFSLLKVFGIIALVLFALTAIGYYIYAAIIGGKYCVLFEMDDEGVRHTQLDSQVSKAKAVAAIAAALGTLSGEPGAVGTGLLAGSRSSMYTSFSCVRNIKLLFGSNTIKLDAPLSHNQIYAEKEDLDAVLSYILDRVPSGVLSGKSNELKLRSKEFLCDAGEKIKKRRLLAVVLALANLAMLGIIISGGTKNADSKHTYSSYEESYADADENEFDYDTASDTVSFDLTGTGKPIPADFTWFTDGICTSLQMPDGGVPLDEDALNGSWKCLILYSPEQSLAYQVFSFCNAQVDGSTDNLTFTVSWYMDVFGGETYDRSDEMNAVFTGGWSDGNANFIGPGAFTISSIYELNGKQYAFGRYTPPDGESAVIGLVRP